MSSKAFMQEWAQKVSRRVWSSQIKLKDTNDGSTEKKLMEQFCVGENNDSDDDPVFWFIGLRGGVYSLKGYSKIKSS
jgi:hypothetical protein